MKNIKTWSDKDIATRTFGDRVADLITNFVGSWTFVVLHIIWFAAWVMFPVEPFPFGLLTMIVSLEAIMLSTFIMMSQNRASDRDRHQAEADYDTNRVAKEEIESLQRDLARIESDKLDKIVSILESKG
jgi:uncharacterized membrane protein